jgi:hypothetical protein
VETAISDCMESLCLYNVLYIQLLPCGVVTHDHKNHGDCDICCGLHPLVGPCSIEMRSGIRITNYLPRCHV